MLYHAPDAASLLIHTCNMHLLMSSIAHVGDSHLTCSVLLKGGLYEGGAHHHVAKVIHNYSFARPLVHVQEFASPCHHILHPTATIACF